MFICLPPQRYGQGVLSGCYKSYVRGGGDLPISPVQEGLNVPSIQGDLLSFPNILVTIVRTHWYTFFLNRRRRRWHFHG